MKAKIDIQPLQPEDLPAAAQLVERSFDDTVAPTLSSEGIRRFKAGLQLTALQQRLSGGNLFLACKQQQNIVGMAEVRNGNHINLLFVEPRLQRSGIGRMLVKHIKKCIDSDVITVNSSMNAVAAYTQFGFRPSGPESERQGIKYQPMVLNNKPQEEP